MADDAVGFHAQQAVEKAMKAVLVLEGVAFPRTHDLEFLAARLRERRVDLPRELEHAQWLTHGRPSFATTSRHRSIAMAP